MRIKTLLTSLFAIAFAVVVIGFAQAQAAPKAPADAELREEFSRYFEEVQPKGKCWFLLPSGKSVLQRCSPKQRAAQKESAFRQTMFGLKQDAPKADASKVDPPKEKKKAEAKAIPDSFALSADEYTTAGKDREAIRVATLEVENMQLKISLAQQQLDKFQQAKSAAEQKLNNTLVEFAVKHGVPKPNVGEYEWKDADGKITFQRNAKPGPTPPGPAAN